MPIYMEISRIHRTVAIVARGRIAPDEVQGMARQLAEANVRSFAKIIEVAGATTEFTPAQISAIAAFLRGATTEKRGPVAFVVDREHTAFPAAFANQTQGDGPIRLFTSLREARSWVEQVLHNPTAGETSAVVVQAHDRWSPPDRRGTLFRGSRQREVLPRARNAA